MTSGEFVFDGSMETPMTWKLSIITEGGKMAKPTNLNLIHPGAMLKEDFLDSMKISMNRLARDISVPVNRISEIINGKRRITADTAIRLGLYFGLSPQFWMNLQSQHDLQVVEREHGVEIASRVVRLKAA
jgi:addiction module HigA family antidote